MHWKNLTYKFLSDFYPYVLPEMFWYYLPAQNNWDIGITWTCPRWFTLKMAFSVSQDTGGDILKCGRQLHQHFWQISLQFCTRKITKLADLNFFLKITAGMLQRVHFLSVLRSSTLFHKSINQQTSLCSASSSAVNMTASIGCWVPCSKFAAERWCQLSINISYPQGAQQQTHWQPAAADRWDRQPGDRWTYRRMLKH